MKYIDSPSNDAYFNMALEEYVFEALAPEEDFFMLWQNENAVVVGKFQNTIEEINSSYIQEHNISVVRRLSGGGAMYQDMGNLNFTFIVKQSMHKNLDFGVFIQPVIYALEQIGVQAEFNSRNDITIDGKKFSGNSQYNKKGRTMHHGTLLFRSNLAIVGEALRVKADKIQSKGIKSVRSRVTNIYDYLPEKISIQNFKQVLLKHMFTSNENLIEYKLTPDDIGAIQNLRDNKYATWEWNYGKSPQYNHCKERRFPFGSVEVKMDVQQGNIQQIIFSGDFFGNGELSQLEDILIGCPLQEECLKSRLEAIQLSNYIDGMQINDFVQLILL